MAHGSVNSFIDNRWCGNTGCFLEGSAGSSHPPANFSSSQTQRKSKLPQQRQ
ncbi:hypothetical protein PGT21_005853 [Puccinia graminis f. sp. tritici]|uniref:Uncharacterized protein n=1 Tax=Puccinia graminis f. sp. tritici TaxID=56615 RepID=A0A5B0LJT4_PUCGR|nr:hypothetical protein PGT21_005853 [Puccinia graminis f. sp. tritici]